MNFKTTLLSALLFLGAFTSGAQIVSLPCPANSDFELGDYSVWNYYIGSCCPGGSITAPFSVGSPPGAAYIPCSFALTGPAPAVAPVAVTGVDPWGGFPVVGVGRYSMRLGSNRTNYWAEKAEYLVHVPPGLTNYSLIYQYAVVLEDPGHAANAQPRFTVQAIDSASGAILPCANFNYVAGSLPGFVGPVGATFATASTCGGSPNDVYYKPWATTSINLSAYGGRTIRMQFAAGGCGQAGHFGYGYIDMTCGTFAINTIGCGDSVATVSAPSGFANYAWYDSLTFKTLFGTTQTVTFPMPPVPTTYAVIMSPFAGFGCPDTLYTHIQPTDLRLHKMPDTSICAGQSVTLRTGATDIALPLTYVWFPTSTLSCGTCANPVATPFAGVTTYEFTVTDAAGCNLTDSIKVTVDSVACVATSVPTSCFGFKDGQASVTPSSGVGPFTYSWSTIPMQTTTTITNLAVGSYVVTAVDSKGCSGSSSTTVIEPPPLTMSIGGTTNPTTCGGNDGTITLNGLQASTGYTVRYLFTATFTTTTVATTVSYVSTPVGSVILTGLSQGSYDSISIVTASCPYNTLGPIVLTDPPPPALPYVSSNTPVCDSGELDLVTTDVTPGVTYSWSGPNGFTSAIQTPTISPATFANAGWYVVTVTVHNCSSKDSAKVVIVDIPKPKAWSNSPICSGQTLQLNSTAAPGGADFYLWNGPLSFSSNEQNPFIKNTPAAASGVYSVTITYNGCSNIATTTVTVNQTPPPPIPLDTNYCQFDTPVPPIGAIGTNLLWYTGPTGGVGDTVAPTPSTQLPGITTWYVTQTSAEGCVSDRAPVKVGIYKFPDPKFVISDSVYCEGTYFTFEVSNANTGVDYQGLTWNFGNGDSVLNVNPVVHAFNALGGASIGVSIYYYVCPDITLSHNALVYPYPVINLGIDTSICPGGEAIIIGDNINEGTAAATWLWNTGETTPFITVVAPGTFYEKVTINGCSTTDTITVLNDCYMNIPNVFTPNGDGVNDYFYPRQYLTRGLTTFSMSIYNRWGQLVFHTTTLDGRGWDGRFNDVPQPEGVFVYIIEATFKDGQKEHHQGNVTLLR